MSPSPAVTVAPVSISFHDSSDGGPARGADPGRGWRMVLVESVGIVLGILCGGAFGTLAGVGGALGGAFLGALVAGSAVAAGRAGHRYGWSTAPHPISPR